MNTHTTHLTRLGAALALSLLLPLAGAAQRGTSATGVDFLSGGATLEEETSMRADRQSYNFWLATAAKGSGAQLADVMVRITEFGSGRLVVETKMDGPWLFAALPVGRYAVEATIASGRGGMPETKRTTATVNGGAAHQAMMVFATGDQTAANLVVSKAAPSTR